MCNVPSFKVLVVSVFFGFSACFPMATEGGPVQPGVKTTQEVAHLSEEQIKQRVEVLVRVKDTNGLQCLLSELKKGHSPEIEDVRFNILKGIVLHEQTQLELDKIKERK